MRQIHTNDNLNRLIIPILFSKPFFQEFLRIYILYHEYNANNITQHLLEYEIYINIEYRPKELCIMRLIFFMIFFN